MLYIFYGPDSFSRREALDELKSKLDTDGALQTNTTVLDARQATVQEIIAACDTVPFLAESRLVIVEGLLQQAARGGPKRGRKKAPAQEPSSRWQPLVEYVDRMPQSTVLVLLDGKIESASDLQESLAEKGEARRFELPDQKSLPGWIQRRAAASGLRMDAGAVRLLADLVGNDLWALASELEKLSVYAAGQPVREADVRSLVSKAREEKGYLLADAIADGRPAQALRLLHELRQQGEPLQVLLATIQGRFRRLAIAREMIDAGMGASAIGQRLGAKGYGLERMLDQASRYPLEKIRAAYDRLVQADADVKRGLVEEQVSMDLLVDDLASGRNLIQGGS